MWGVGLGSLGIIPLLVSDGDGVYLSMMFQTIIPTIWGGFVLFFLIDYVSQRSKRNRFNGKIIVINKNSIMLLPY